MAIIISQLYDVILSSTDTLFNRTRLYQQGDRENPNEPNIANENIQQQAEDVFVNFQPTVTLPSSNVATKSYIESMSSGEFGRRAGIEIEYSRVIEIIDVLCRSSCSVFHCDSI